MSRLLDKLETRKTGTEFPLFNEIVTVTETYDTPYSVSRGIEYRIMVTLGAKAVVPDSPSDSGKEALTHAISHVKRNIIEAVFGEFRQDLQLISTYLYNRDVIKANEAVRNLERKMFEV